MFSYAQWLIPNKVVVCKYSGDLYVEDATNAAEAILELIDASPSETIHVIYDMQDIGPLKFELKDALQSPVAQRFYAHPKLRWSVYVGNRAGNFYTFVTSVINQSYDAKMRWFDTIDEATKFLIDMDDEIASADQAS